MEFCGIFNFPVCSRVSSIRQISRYYFRSRDSESAFPDVEFIVSENHDVDTMVFQTIHVISTVNIVKRDGSFTNVRFTNLTIYVAFGTTPEI